MQNALKLQVVVLGPLLCAFALLGPFVVARFMGVRWTPSLRVYPFIAAGVLINSVFNLQASALFVVGRQWLVLKSYASHVALLILGTWFLIPHFGIAGYGWADLTACLGYWFLQSGSLASIGISYRRLAPWVLGFVAPLFAPFTHSMWSLALCLPLCAVLAHEAWSATPWPLWDRDRAYAKFARRLPVIRLAHLATFLFKTRQRGWPYVQAVLLYQVRSRAYRLQVNLRKAFHSPELFVRHQSRSRSAPDHTVLSWPSVHQVFHFEATDIPTIVASIPDSIRTQTLAEADHILSQHFHFRGRAVTLIGDIDWQAHPGGNVSWEWDLNRHRYFVALGTAYYYSHRLEYLDKLVNLWEQWIAANPVCQSPAWRQPFEVASRLRNWIWAYFLLERSGQFRPHHLQRLEGAIRQHGVFLYSNLEYHWPNNHLLLEATTLYEYALLFPATDQKVATRARSLLIREIAKQILPDGGHSELCTMYHRIVAGELAQLSILCRRLGKPLPCDVEDQIRKSVSFTRALQRDEGSVPLTGDSAADDTNLRFDFASPERSELTYWTKSEQTSKVVASEHRIPPPNLQLFPASGYAFLRAGAADHRLHLTFDFGPFSRCPSANHAHADALSFDLHAGGRPLLVDPGVYLPWDDDGSWARHFRSTAAHNTLVIDGRDQSELCRFADVGRTASTRIVGYQSSEDEVQVTADCVPYWVDGREICHTRTISARNDGHIFIRDNVTGSGHHRLQWYFHVAADLDAVLTSPGEFVLRLPATGRDLARIRAQSVRTPSLKLTRGQTEPRQGWVSLNSAAVLPAYVATFSTEAELPFSLSFEIELYN